MARESSRQSIGWLSDNHIGLQQYGLKRRREDFAHATLSAIQDMADQGIHEVICSGDLIHTCRPSPDDVMALRKIEDLMIQRSMRMYFVSGNHDNSNPHWCDAIGLTRFINLHYRTVEIGNGLTIRGLPNMSREDFLKHEHETADILIMHQAVQEFTHFKSQNDLSVAEIPINLYKVVAMGDIHITDLRQELDGLPSALHGYPGSTEMNSATESESKYWVKLDFDGRSLVGHQLEPIKTRTVIRFDIGNEQELEAAVAVAIRNYSDTKGLKLRAPMVFVKFKAHVPNVITRFRSALDPDDCVLHFDPVFEPKDASGKAIMADGEDHVDVLRLMESMVPPDSQGHRLASMLVNADLDPALEIERFVEGELQKLEVANGSGAPAAP